MVFLEMPSWLAMSSIETERMPNFRKRAFDSVMILVLLSMVDFGTQNYGNF